MKYLKTFNENKHPIFQLRDKNIEFIERNILSIINDEGASYVLSPAVHSTGFRMWQDQCEHKTFIEKTIEVFERLEATNYFKELKVYSYKMIDHKISGNFLLSGKKEWNMDVYEDSDIYNVDSENLHIIIQGYWHWDNPDQ